MDTNDQPLRGKRCLGLVRTSTGEQTETSIPQQTKLLKDFAEGQGMIWVGVEEVEGVSGSSPGARTDLERLRRRKVEDNDYEIVAIQDRSRWTRAGGDHGAWLRVEFGRIGVRIVNVNFPITGNDRYTWMIEGMQDEASLSYVRQLSHDVCRGVMEKIEEGVLATCRTPPFAVDRLYLDADDRPLCIIRNLRDGRQQRLHHETREEIEVYPANVKNVPTRHHRKHKLDKVRLIPGADDAVSAVRYILRQYYVTGWGYRRIACGLNDQGILSAHGAIWGIPSVEQVVHGTIYCGVGIGNMWESGKFHVRNAVRPKTVAYDMYELMNVKYKRRKLRPPEEWVIKEYPALNEILGDERLRKSIWEMQYDYWKRKAAGLLTPQKKDRHVNSTFFLKHVLRCRETGMPLVGKLSSRNTRYYFLSRGQHYPDKDKPYLSRSVAAKPLEEAARGLLQELLRSDRDLDRNIREAVAAEIKKADHSVEETEAIEQERKHVSKQIGFALRNLVDLGDEAVNEIVSPLKEKLHTLDRRLSTLKETGQRGAIDVDATITTIRSQLTNMADSTGDLPPEYLRRLFQTFMDMTIDLKDFTVHLDVRVPTWAIQNADRLSHLVGTESPPSATGRLCAHSVEAVKLAEYRCQFHREGQHRRPCFKCKRYRLSVEAPVAIAA